MMIKKQLLAGAIAASLAGAGLVGSLIGTSASYADEAGGEPVAEVVGVPADASGSVPDIGGPDSFAIAAQMLGMTESDLLAEIDAGKSISSVAEAEGVDARAVIDALTADATAQIEDFLATGALDTEVADLFETSLFRTDRGVHDPGR